VSLNKDQIEETINDVCPRCAKGEPVKFRADTGEWTHVSYAAAGFSSTICMATHLRSKYQAVLNG
jgi:hypothetical protein